MPTQITKALRDAGTEQVLLNLKDRVKMILDGSAPMETLSGLQRDPFLQFVNITTQATLKTPLPTTGQVEHLELPQQRASSKAAAISTAGSAARRPAI